MAVPLRQAKLTFLTAFLQCGVGVNLENIPGLQGMGAFVSNLKGPWMLFGGWNNEPAQLQQTGWLTKVGDEVVHQPNVDCTCNVPNGGGA